MPIQIGVGALACAAVRALADGERVIVGVEPADAGCALAAVRAGGRPVLVPGPHRSIMAGLNCGLASQVALPDMAAGITAFCTIDDARRRGGGAAAARRTGCAAARPARPAWPGCSRCAPTGRRTPGSASGWAARPAALAICTEATDRRGVV